MLQLRNHTSLRVRIASLPETDGADTLVVMAKATVALTLDAASLEPDQIHLADVYAGEAGRSSIVTPGELSLRKSATDVLIAGSARAPGGHPTTDMLVTATVGPMTKTIRVLGNRTWRPGWWAARPTELEPFESLALGWENAYGGQDRPKDPRLPLSALAENPIGIGYRLKRSATPLTGQRLPNLVDPTQPSPKAPHAPLRPVGLGAIPPAWKPRQQWAGTYDDAWRSARAPFLPDDFDRRFLQQAPADQVVEGLTGGEPIRLEGFAHDGCLEGHVPAANLRMTADIGGSSESIPVHLDTVIIDTERRVVSALWRGCLRAENRLLKIRTITIDQDLSR